MIMTLTYYASFTLIGYSPPLRKQYYQVLKWNIYINPNDKELSDLKLRKMFFLLIYSVIQIDGTF